MQDTAEAGNAIEGTEILKRESETTEKMTLYAEFRYLLTLHLQNFLLIFIIKEADLSIKSEILWLF